MNNKSNKLYIWISLAAIIVVLAVGIGYFAISSGTGNRVSQEIDIAQSQKIVDDAFASIAKSTAEGAKLVLDRTEITVEDVSFGNNKDVILKCTYKTLNTQGVLEGCVNELMENVYGFYDENTKAGKRTNATKVNLYIKNDIYTRLSDAEVISGEITLYIYETVDGMELFLNKDAVNTCTGGLITVIDKIESTTEVNYQGQTIDITNNNTLRRGISDCLALETLSSAQPATGNKLEKTWLDFQDDFYRNFIEKARWKYLVQGLGTTLSITVLAALLGILIGFVVAIIRCTNQMTGKLKIINALCQFYLTVTRGTPVMVQLMILFFVFLLPLDVDKFPAAVICFGLNSGAYVAEIVRGGIMSVDKGQIEAGRSLGFNYVQTMIHFVVPQAFKAILPSLANEFITLLKESSVAFYIGVSDLTQAGLKIRSITYSNFLPLIAVAVIYLVLVMILTKLVSLLERRLAKSDH